MPTQRTITIQIDDKFGMKLMNQDYRPLVQVRMTRIEAQRLAAALLEFARGWGIKGGRRFFSAEEITGR